MERSLRDNMSRIFDNGSLKVHFGGDWNSNTSWQMAYTPLGAALFAIFGCFLIMIIVGGNAMVLIAVIRDPRLRNNRQNWLIASLASADLLVGLLIMPLTLTYEIIGTWKMGMFLCELWLALDVLFVTSSILNLCAISLDRYWSVVDPLSYPAKRTPNRMRLMVFFTWLISLTICFPPLVGWRPKRSPGECNLSSDIGYVMYSALGSFFLPVIVIIVVYYRIYSIGQRQIHKRMLDTRRTQASLHQCSTNRVRSIRTSASDDHTRTTSIQSSTPQPKSSTPVNMTLLSLSEDNHQKLMSSISPRLELQTLFRCQGQITRKYQAQMQQNVVIKRRMKQLKAKERQSTVLLGLILMGFILCWLPFFIIYLLGAVGIEAPANVFTVFFWLGYCNSGVNPVIYTIFNREFKHAFYKLLGVKHHFGRRKMSGTSSRTSHRHHTVRQLV